MVAQFFYDFASAVQNAVSSPDPEKVNKWEKAVLRQMGATGYRMANDRYDKSLLEMTQEVNKAFGISKPSRVIVYEQKYPNAAYLRMSNTMIISTSLLEALNDQELRAVLSHENSRRVKGVIGHEIGHQTQRDFLTAFALAFTAISVVATSFFTSKFKNSIGGFFRDTVSPKLKEDSIWQKGSLKLATAVERSPWAVATAFGIVGSAVAWVLGFPSAAIQRKLELDADKKAAEKLRDPEALASALLKISEYAQQARQKQILPTDINARDSNIIPEPPAPDAPPSNLEKTLAEAKASHPSIEKRVRILREMAVQQQEEGLSAYRA